MAHKYILDTHALVWYLEGNKRLSKQARAIIEAPDSDMILPLIALSEAALIIEKGRSSISNINFLLNRITHDPRIEIYPMTWEVFEHSLTPKALRIPELHDRLIVSTGLYLQDLGHTVSIVTKDQVITKVAVVPVIW